MDDIVAGILQALDRAPRDDGPINPGGFATPHSLYNIGNNPPERLIDLIGSIERSCGRGTYSDAGWRRLSDPCRH